MPAFTYLSGHELLDMDTLSTPELQELYEAVQAVLPNIFIKEVPLNVTSWWGKSHTVYRYEVYHPELSVNDSSPIQRSNTYSVQMVNFGVSEMTFSVGTLAIGAFLIGLLQGHHSTEVVP